MVIDKYTQHPKGEKQQEVKMILAQKIETINIKKVDETVTGKIGLSWIYHAIMDFGIEQIIRNNFPKTKSNKEIKAIAKIIAGVLMLISGGEKIEDIELLRKDKALLNSMGFENFICPDTFLNFLAVKRNAAKIRRIIEALVIKALKIKSTLTELTYDNDATYFDSDKKSASYSYKKSKQMSGLLGFFVELGNICVTMDYRTGSVNPRTGILNQLRKAISLAAKAEKKIANFRSDSAAHNGAVMDLCNKKGINYYISLVENAEIKAIIGTIKEEDWKAVPEQPGKQWAESYYVMPYKVKKKTTYLSMRILILRWENKKEDNANQPCLLEIKNYKYHTISTNNETIEPMEWLEFHNGRMGSENNNKELKYGYEIEYTPSNDFNKNRCYFMLGIMAYNIVQIVKLFYLGKVAEKWNIKRIRNYFINVCGKFIYHSRKLTCKIINATDLTFSLFENCLRRFVWRC
jgi:hypothetical protein